MTKGSDSPTGQEKPEKKREKEKQNLFSCLFFLVTIHYLSPGIKIALFHSGPRQGPPYPAPEGASALGNPPSGRNEKPYIIIGQSGKKRGKMIVPGGIFRHRVHGLSLPAPYIGRSGPKGQIPERFQPLFSDPPVNLILHVRGGGPGPF
jgi:hypothetical protein